MSFLSSLQWRYATKKFDTTKKISDADVHTLTEAIRMTPTSFGMQPYHFYIVSSQDMRDQIGPVAWGQPQISTCSHLIIFVARSDLLVLTDDLFTTMSGGDATVRTHLK
jgi:nitroreductase